MDVIVINGGSALAGTVTASGAKNAALPLVFSSLLAEGVYTFHNVPQLKDIDSAELLLNHLNCETHRDGNRLKVTINRPGSLVAPYDIVRKMRAFRAQFDRKEGESDTRLDGTLDEGPVSLVHEEKRAERRNVRVVGCEEIDVSIAIHIAPDRRFAEAFNEEPEFLSDVNEIGITVVPEEERPPPVAEDHQVDITV